MNLIIDVLLSLFVYGCLIGIVVLNVVAIFGDRFLADLARRDQ